MNQQLYKKISSGWRKPIYQLASKQKTRYVLQYAHLLTDKRVVDIGSNAGIITHDLSEFVSEFVGVEHNEHYYRQSLDTLKYIEIPGTFVNLSLGDFINTTDFDYNAIFASCVLYHLSQEEIELIRDVMLPECDIVLFISREDKTKTNNTYWLNKWRNIKAFLIAAGMDVETHNVDSNWVTVVGRNN